MELILPDILNRGRRLRRKDDWPMMNGFFHDRAVSLYIVNEDVILMDYKQMHVDNWDREESLWSSNDRDERVVVSDD